MPGRALKIAVIGGGSTYTSELIEGCLHARDEVPVGEIWLMDINPTRLEILGAFAQRMVNTAGASIQISTTADRQAAIAGADFVISQFRVGGMESRNQDIRLGLRHNTIGQETTGVGGFAKALRTIPVALDVCRDMRALAPSAWLINFTNPSGLVSEAIMKYGGVKVIGLCNVPITMKMMIARAMRWDAARVRLDYVGLNHLGWVRHVYLDGEDRMDQVLGKIDFFLRLPIVSRLAGKYFDRELIQALRMLPSPYLRYYYNTAQVLEEERRAKKNRAEVVMELEQRLLERYKDPRLKRKPRELGQRGGAYYSTAAVQLISALHNDAGDEQIVNVRNGDCIADLPPDAVVEVPCVIHKDGARPLPVGHVEPVIRGLMQAVKTYEQLAVEAAVHGDRRMAFQALLAHPLIRQADLAKALLEDLLVVNHQFLPQFYS